MYEGGKYAITDFLSVFMRIKAREFYPSRFSKIKNCGFTADGLLGALFCGLRGGYGGAKPPEKNYYFLGTVSQSFKNLSMPESVSG